MNTGFVITAILFPAVVLWPIARYRALNAIGAVLTGLCRIHGPTFLWRESSGVTRALKPGGNEIR